MNLAFRGWPCLASLPFPPSELNPQCPLLRLFASQTKATLPSFLSATSRQKASPPEPKQRRERHRNSSFIVRWRNSPVCWLKVQHTEYRIKKRETGKGREETSRSKVANKKMIKYFLTQEAFFFFFCKYHAKQAAGVP